MDEEGLLASDTEDNTTVMDEQKTEVTESNVDISEMSSASFPHTPVEAEDNVMNPSDVPAANISLDSSDDISGAEKSNKDQAVDTTENDGQEETEIDKEKEHSPSKSNDKEEKSVKETRKSLEKEVGLTQYAGTHEGFFGIIKQRFSDFVVNEVESSGDIVRIVEQSVPNEPEEIHALPSELPPELTPDIISQLNKLAGIREVPRLPLPPPPRIKKDKEEADGEEEEKSKSVECQGDLSDQQDDTVKSGKGSETGGGEAMDTEESRDEETEEQMKQHKNGLKDAKEKVEEQKEQSNIGSAEYIPDKMKKVDYKTRKSYSTDRKRQSHSSTEVYINVDSTDKEGRTAIHRVVKAKYHMVDSIYRELDGQKFILVRKKKAGGSEQRRSSWPKSQMYTTFVMYKENVDTMEAINYLAYKTRVKPNNFTYAGTKDKRGKTSQLVSVSRVAPERLWQAAIRHRGIELGNFRFRPTPQKLGQLRGNHFRIVLREVKGSDETITSGIDSLKTKGFINYYGLQRFGTTSIPTHVIGRELLKSNWQQAINLILTPRKNDIPELNRCRNTWKDTGDAELALKAIPRGWESSIEAQLLNGLVQLQKNDLVGALNRIPRNTRLLYLHAYQSYLWNIVASRRITKYGLNPIPGDIIRHKEKNTELESPTTTQISEDDGSEEKVEIHWWTEEVTKAVDEKKEAYNLMMQTEGVSEEEQKERQKKYHQAKQKTKRIVKESKKKAEEEMEKYWKKLKTLPPDVMKEENSDEENSDDETRDKEPSAVEEGEEVSGQKSHNLHFLMEDEVKTANIFDVLIPLPGYNVEYPHNEIKEWYKELLEVDGLSLESLKHRVKSYALGGAYRRLLVQPSNVSGAICFYKDSTKSLIQSDMDKLKEIDINDNKLNEGPHKAVILEMSLPPSSYATVALRELLKMDTSSEFQSTLNSTGDSTLQNRDFRNKRGMPWSREGHWRGSDKGGSWKHQGFRGSWRGGHDDKWGKQRERSGDRGGRNQWGDGYHRGGRGGWRGRGEKRFRGGREDWNAKRGKYY